MNLPDFKKIAINGVEMKELRIGDTLIWKSGHTNLMPLSTEADGVTIYNGGLGFKKGYRVRSGGAEAVASNYGFCTGYFPFKTGDVIRIYTPYGHEVDSSMPSLNVYDNDSNNLGQMACNGMYGIFNTYDLDFSDYATIDGNILTIIIPKSVYEVANTIAFARLSLKIYSNEESNMAETIITVNEEIEL